MDSVSGKKALAAFGALLSAFSLAACSSERSKAGPPSVSATVQGEGSGDEARVIVTRDNGRLSPLCGPREVGNLILTFVEYFNQGDSNAIDRLFAPQGVTRDIGEDAKDGEISFQWYVATVDERFGGGNIDGVEGDRSRLLSYFFERYRQHERMRLLFLSLGVENPFPGAEESWVGGEIILARNADDLAKMGITDGIAHGKFSINCDSQTIFAWSIGTEQARSKDPKMFGPGAGPCPIPPDWTRTSGVAIVCTRP